LSDEDSTAKDYQPFFSKVHSEVWMETMSR